MSKIEMETTQGVSISWHIEGDEVVVESNVPLDEESFFQCFPPWIFDALDKKTS